jgi:hypothetical protein
VLMYNQVGQEVLHSAYRTHLCTCFMVFGKTSIFSYIALTGSFVLITETKLVYSAVLTESLNVIQVNFSLSLFRKVLITKLMKRNLVKH